MTTRLAELRPLVDEHARLEAASQALDDAHDTRPLPRRRRQLRDRGREG